LLRPGVRFASRSCKGPGKMLSVPFDPGFL
jgi:hypothetical protein